MSELQPRRVSSAVACAIAAARAQAACDSWALQLTAEDRALVERRLRERQEWKALEAWTRAKPVSR